MPGDRTGRLHLLQGDITTLAVDAIVNAANHRLQRGGGVCGAIFRAAGPGLEEACRALEGCPVGSARLTPGFGLPARFVIHAVGPVWRLDGHGEELALLAQAYRESLALCELNGFATLAAPLIGTGHFGIPMRLACETALREIQAWLRHHGTPREVTLVAFDGEAMRTLQSAWADLPAE